MNHFTEEDVRLAIADWRRHYRKVTVYKAAVRVGLTILICVSALAIVYALGF